MDTPNSFVREQKFDAFQSLKVETVTHSRSRWTVHASQSSVSLVASVSSLTSLSSVSFTTSGALNKHKDTTTC